MPNDPDVIGDDASVVDPDADSDEGALDELPDVVEDDVGEEATDDDIDDGDDGDGDIGDAAAPEA